MTDRDRTYPALTPREANIFRAFVLLYKERGYMPTVREVAKHLGISRTRVAQKVVVLLNRGYLRRVGLPFQSRNLSLT